MRYEPEVISNNIKHSQKIKKIVNIVLYILLVPTIIFCLFLIVAELGNSEENPSSFDIDVYIISSASMEPKLNVNDIIVVKKGLGQEEYKKGNIITFYDEKNEMITHRIVSIVNLGEQLGFVTKGDNNETEDDQVTKYEDVVGKVIFTMPRIGAIVSVLKNKAFFSFLVVCLVLIVIYDIRVSCKQMERKKVREKYDKKTKFRTYKGEK